jgi:hypothetical protein
MNPYPLWGGDYTSIKFSKIMRFIVITEKSSLIPFVDICSTLSLDEL